MLKLAVVICGDFREYVKFKHFQRFGPPDFQETRETRFCGVGIPSHERVIFWGQGDFGFSVGMLGFFNLWGRSSRRAPFTPEENPVMREVMLT